MQETVALLAAAADSSAFAYSRSSSELHKAYTVQSTKRTRALDAASVFTASSEDRFSEPKDPLVTARPFAPSKGPPRSSQAQLICSAAREADDWVLSRAATRRPVAQEVCLHG